MTSATSHFTILGHRGSPLRQHENTLASLRLALDEGAAGFETDIRTLSDGAVVLFHDDEVGGHAVETLDFAELRAVSPSLVRLGELEPLVGDAAITLEVKRWGNEKAIFEVIRDWSNITVSSFDHRVLRRMRAAGFGGKLGVVFYGYLDEPADYAARLDASIVYPAFRYVDRDLVDQCSRAGISVIPWTPNDADHWTYLLSVGCQGVITDLPSEAVLWQQSPL